jgi:3',5'-cyclic AMP phosphodiesterase CpdA
MFRIAHISDLHCGSPHFVPNLLERAILEVNEVEPDAVVCSGDLTTFGFRPEYAEAAGYLERIECPVQVVIPGNHDSRNVGYVHFEQLFQRRRSRHRIEFDNERAEHLRAPGVTVVAIDSSEPDLDEGRIGRESYAWIREQFDEPDDFKIFVLHHHLVAIPGTGRDLNHITDAGDLLPVLTGLGVDVVLSGHRHVPYFWGLNGMFIANAGTASSRRTRGTIQPSWNELVVDSSSIRVFLHYEDDRRELSAIRSRTTRETIREAFYLTEAFRVSNRILGV